MYLFSTLFLILLAAGFPMLICPADAVAEFAAGFVVAVALAGLTLVNMVFFSDPSVRAQLSRVREARQFSRQQRAERLAAIDSARAAVIVNAAVLRAEQAAARVLEQQFATIAAAQAALCRTFKLALDEVQDLKYLPPEEFAENTGRLKWAFQRMADHLSPSPPLLESPK